MNFLKPGFTRRYRSFLLAALAAGFSEAGADPLPGGTLDPLSVPKFVTPLVIPPVMNDTGMANDYNIAVRQFKQQILPGGIWNTVTGRTDAFPATTVWSYGPAADPAPDSSALGGGAGVAPAANSQFNYPAYTVEARNGAAMEGVPITVDWINDLKDPVTHKFLPHLLAVDQTLHWANPGADCIDHTQRTDCRGKSAAPYRGPVPIVTHVHGAHTDPDSDGYPESWWLPDPKGSNFKCVSNPRFADPGKNRYVCQGTRANQYGTGVNTARGTGAFHYRNDQPSATLWYHDHALGMTRNNVYAGPAGFWLVRKSDGGENGLDAGTLPGPAPVRGQAVLDLNIPDNPVRTAIHEIPIAIQDRSFNADGSLFYPKNRAFFEGLGDGQVPSVPGNRNAGMKIAFIGSGNSDISPIWNPEAFFNTIVVNGVAWPYLDVAPERYRFRLLNGCDARFLNLSLFVVNSDGSLGDEIPIYQIGSEQSLLPAVVKVRTGFKTPLPINGPEQPADDPAEALLMGLAERADVIVDFHGLPDGTRVRMINTGPDAPFGGFPIEPAELADADTTGQVMEFVVRASMANAAGDPSTPVADLQLSLPDALEAQAPSTGFQDLALLEEESEKICVRIRPDGTILQINRVQPGPNFATQCAAFNGVPMAPKAAVLGTNGSTGGVVQMWADPITTNPAFNSTETWELWNWTADAHPIHLHEIKFKVVDREVIGGSEIEPPEATEQGWKDSVITYPGEVTRVKAKFDIAGLYVWHCHIVEHEDNEMMVPYCVGDRNANGCQGL